MIEHALKSLAGTAMSVALLCASSAIKAQERRSNARSSPASAAALGAGFEDQYVNVNDVRLHYVRGGKGPAVLLVPGWPETWWAWRKIMPELATKFTVIAVDTRGMGDSSRPMSGYDMRSVAGDLYQLMSQLGCA